MPNRMLRDWTDSDKVNGLSVHAERFFTRLIMKVDDYGCFYSHASLLKANLFPLLLDNIREADIARWMAECHKAGLIVLYEVKSKKYLQIIDFKQRLDKAKAKYPLPNVVNEPITNVNDFPAEVEVEPEREVEEETEGRDVFKNPFDDKFLTNWNQWKTYKKTEYKFLYKSVQSEQAAINELVELSAGIQETAAAIIQQSMSKGWKGFFQLKKVDDGTKKRNGEVSNEQLNESFTKFHSQKKSA